MVIRKTSYTQTTHVIHCQTAEEFLKQIGLIFAEDEGYAYCQTAADDPKSISKGWLLSSGKDLPRYHLCLNIAGMRTELGKEVVSLTNILTGKDIDAMQAAYIRYSANPV